jgi:hypothetical protein
MDFGAAELGFAAERWNDLVLNFAAEQLTDLLFDFAAERLTEFSRGP